MKIENEIKALDEAIEILRAYVKETYKLEELTSTITNQAEIFRDDATAVLKACQRTLTKKEEELRAWAVES